MHNIERSDGNRAERSTKQTKSGDKKKSPDIKRADFKHDEEKRRLHHTLLSNVEPMACSSVRGLLRVFKALWRSHINSPCFSWNVFSQCPSELNKKVTRQAVDLKICVKCSMTPPPPVPLLTLVGVWLAGRIQKHLFTPAAALQHTELCRYGSDTCL